MKADALETLARIYGEAAEMAAGSGIAPTSLLTAVDGAWRPSDIRRLSKLARIAASMNDIPAPIAEAAERVAMEAREGQFVNLEETSCWASALRWAIDDLSSNTWFGIHPGSTTREREVGAAGVRLRKAGYVVTVDGNGCRMVEAQRLELLRRVNGLVRQLGGVEVLMQLFRMLDEQGRLKDGMWLLGDVVPPIGQRKQPTIPYGLLFALGLKHVRPTKTLRRPDVAWSSLVALSRDYAALMDVERYGNLERVDVRPGELITTLREALGWHQLFTFPRYSSAVVHKLVRAMREVLVGAQWKAFGVQPSMLEAELKTLFGMVRRDGLAVVGKACANRSLPILVGLASARHDGVNAKFVDPFDADKRTSDGIILFEFGEQYVVLPEAVAAAQAATMLVTRIWKTLDAEDAKKAVGAICERVVTSICAKSVDVEVATDLTYHVGGQRFQIDVLATEGDEITLLEVKAKSLTGVALSGDMAQYLLDYDSSYLAMLKQLVRHETHLRKGNAELPSIEAESSISKVAVSPLTYGPLSDAHLGRSILLALFSAKLGVSVPDDKAANVLANLEKNVKTVGRSFGNLIGNGSAGQYRDLRVALMAFQWLDMAQLAAVVVAGGGVSSGLRMLRHVTFASHDFWHEISFRAEIDLGRAKAPAT